MVTEQGDLLADEPGASEVRVEGLRSQLRSLQRRHSHMDKGPQKCTKCGGAGGYRGWPGYTCFRCGGNGWDPQLASVRVWADEEAKARAAELRARIEELEREAREAAAAERAEARRREDERREREREALERERREKAAAEGWRTVGEVGEVLEGTARVMVTSDVWGEYGRALFVVLEDQDRKAKLKTIGSGASLMEHARMGQHVRYRGKVKEFDEYEGVPQTRLTRVKLEPVE